MCLGVYDFVCTCLHVFACGCVRLCINARIYLCVCVYICVRVCTCVYSMCLCVSVCACVCILIISLFLIIYEWNKLYIYCWALYCLHFCFVKFSKRHVYKSSVIPYPVIYSFFRSYSGMLCYKNTSETYWKAIMV